MNNDPYKEIAVHFLKLSAKGQSRQAFALYVWEEFKHHNAHFKGDAETLMIAMEDNARKNPDKTLDIQRTLHDGNLVAVHSHVRQHPGDPGVALIHIFRFEGGKIAELWDFGQAVPTEMINEHGMF
jgi:predicted SnoaL-like aldol condensation-catalyzing enzyme